MRNVDVMDSPTGLMLEPAPGFVETPQIKSLVQRALSYLQAGYPVHFSGPAGVGKTTLAMHLARTVGRPTCLIFGDDEFASSDLVGGQFGYRRRKVVDRFIHSVLKMSDDVTSRWADARLTEAFRNGYTLVYDEFNRSRPEANNVLLSVLEEGVMTLPPASGEEETHLEIHPNFLAIFTSNPEEYAGVHKTQDALRDRMVTIELSHYDEETEISITMSQAKLTRSDAVKIVRLVRALREKGPSKTTPTIRACIIIGKVAKLRQIRIDRRDKGFQEICLDVLGSTRNRISATGTPQVAMAHETIPITIGAAAPKQTPKSSARRTPEPLDARTLVQTLVNRCC